MKIFMTLLLSLLVFTSLSVLAAEEKHNDQEHGEGKADFFPKKPADKSLSTRPEQVELLEPKALSVVGSDVTLKWKPAQNAQSYRVQVAKDPNFKWLVTQQDFYKETSMAVKGLEAGKQYFWRVYGLKPNNESNYSSSFGSWSSFEVK